MQHDGSSDFVESRGRKRWPALRAAGAWWFGGCLILATSSIANAQSENMQVSVSIEEVDDYHCGDLFHCFDPAPFSCDRPDFYAVMKFTGADGQVFTCDPTPYVGNLCYINPYWTCTVGGVEQRPILKRPVEFSLKIYDFDGRGLRAIDGDDQADIDPGPGAEFTTGVLEGTNAVRIEGGSCIFSELNFGPCTPDFPPPLGSGGNGGCSEGHVCRPYLDARVILTLTGEVARTPCPPPTDLNGDLDGDGLRNGWEMNGLDDDGDGIIDVDLPAMGADVCHKDLFVEADYMDLPETVDVPVCLNPPTTGQLTAHSHKLLPEAAAILRKAFASAPLTNPDGVSGIQLHIDAGPDSIMTGTSTWGTLSRADVLDHEYRLGDGRLAQIKGDHFDSRRRRVFRYALLAHMYRTCNENCSGECYSGFSSSIDSRFSLTLGGFTKEVGSATEQAGTFMHELGHNLRLHHGGFDDDNPWEPNYLSIMGYTFQFPGLRVNGKDFRFDYHRFSDMPALDEARLDESLGLNGGPQIDQVDYDLDGTVDVYGTRWCATEHDCPFVVDDANQAIDWNHNGLTETEIALHFPESHTGAFQTLRIPAASDWDRLDWTFLQRLYPIAASRPAPDPTGLLVPDAVMASADLELYMSQHLDYLASIEASPGALAAPGATVHHSFVVRNRGTHPDRYTLATRGTPLWSDLSAVPGEIALDPGQEQTFEIPVHVSMAAAPFDREAISVTLQSQANPGLVDSAEIITRVPGGAPRANAGADQAVECAAGGVAAVILDGSASDLPAGRNHLFTWTGPFPEGGGLVSGRTAIVTLPLGPHTVTLTVDDGDRSVARDTAVVTVQDTTPPELLLTVGPSVLWPANHRMVPVTIATATVDVCEGSSPVALESVASSEPDNATGGGDGNTTGDVQIGAPGGPDPEFLLRAERSGSGGGRLYTFTYSATDTSGNRTEEQTGVVVPHDQNGIIEPLDLVVVEEASGTSLRWDAVPDATFYNVLRGSLSRVGAVGSATVIEDASCLGRRLSGTSFTDAGVQETPAPGEVFFYLVEYFDGRYSGYGTPAAEREVVVSSGDACH